MSISSNRTEDHMEKEFHESVPICIEIYETMKKIYNFCTKYKKYILVMHMSLSNIISPSLLCTYTHKHRVPQKL